MLEQQDLMAIESMMRRVVGENNEDLKAEMKEYIAGEFDRNNAEMKKYIAGEFDRNNAELKADLRSEWKEDIRECIHESESFLLDEMERFYKLTQKDIKRLSNKVDTKFVLFV